MAGFIHMRGREYDPVAGSFLSQDPLTPVGVGAGGWNPYAYVLNNPTTLTDPSGFNPFDAFGTLQDTASTAAMSSVGHLNQGYVLDLLSRAWASRPAVSHAQSDVGVQWDLGFLMGIGLDFGLQNGPTLTTPDDARRAYDQGQLIGSAVGMAADIVAIGAGLSILWSGELPALLGGLIGSVFGPEGTAGGALVGTVISVPALIAGLGLTSVGAGLLPGHTSLLDDAVDNLRRMEADGSGSSGGPWWPSADCPRNREPGEAWLHRPQRGGWHHCRSDPHHGASRWRNGLHPADWTGQARAVRRHHRGRRGYYCYWCPRIHEAGAARCGAEPGMGFAAMKRHIELPIGGCTIGFYLHDRKDGYLHFDIEFDFPELDATLPPVRGCSLSFADIERLAAYAESSLNEAREQGDRCLFTAYDAFFSIEFLLDDCVRFMVDYGPLVPLSVGVEGALSEAAVMSFRTEWLRLTEEAW